MTAESTCALCTSEPATTTYDPPRELAERLIDDVGVEASVAELRIPLCDGCHATVAEAVDLAYCPDVTADQRIGERRLNRLLRELNTVTIERSLR